jgi:vacuolar-type H+-ATPase subunit E/Vma4
MPPEMVRPPYELEAPDNHGAEELERERERIRNEVLPLEQKLKQLEAIHSGLETYIAQLQISLRNVGLPSEENSG